MDDLSIVELYFARNEIAIEETDKKYGKLCFSVAKNILSKIASASWTPAGRNFTILAMVLGGSSDSPKTGAAAADQAA